MIEIDDCNIPITEATEFFKSSDIQDEATIRKDGDFGIASPGWLFDEEELAGWDQEFKACYADALGSRGNGKHPPLPVVYDDIKMLVIWMDPQENLLLGDSDQWLPEGDTKAGIRTCGGCLVRFPWGLAREQFDFPAIAL